ncbi:MAG: GDSL-type esterase/lipase family protein [Planctomycetaceae bacterium]|nr:GDSL-type esterase/lipase family protein [Planctomycetaceae bacterium]
MAATSEIKSQPSGQPAARPPRSGRPLWKGALFRTAAILLGLLPLVVCELALRGLGFGKPTDSSDPFVGFSDIHPLFVLDEQAGRYEIPKSRQTHFQPESFAAAKAASEFRVFVLGGSTVQGCPWSIDTSFTTWLELHLNAADPSRKHEVVNCGGVSYASYRLVPILREVLQYQPDLIIFCEGHNEFLEDRTYAQINDQPPLLAWAGRHVSRLRIYNVLRDGVLGTAGGNKSAAASRPVLGPEVDARLDWKDGLAHYTRDPQWQAAVIAHFDDSLRRVVQITEGANVPLVLVSPPANLQWPPFKSEHRADITAGQRDEFEALLKAAEEYAGDLPRALRLLEQAAAIDDQYAQVHHQIGICRLELGALSEAHSALLKAKELDVCPLRMLEPMKAAIHAVASQTQTPLVDAEALLAANSRSGFPDRQWLVDHVHPTISGHQLIADALAEKLADLRLVRRSAGWEADRERAYQTHLASLSHAYFERGKQQLRSEQGWARGWVKRVRDP